MSSYKYQLTELAEKLRKAQVLTQLLYYYL